MRFPHVLPRPLWLAYGLLALSLLAALLHSPYDITLTGSLWLSLFAWRLLPTRAFLSRWLVGALAFSSVILLRALHLVWMQLTIPGLSLFTAVFGMTLAAAAPLGAVALRQSRLSLLARPFALLAALLLFLPPLIFWGYYAFAHACFSTDTMQAILQTNPAEALQYVRDAVPPARVPLLLFLLAAFALLLVWYSRIAALPAPTLKRGGVSLSLLCGALLLALSSYNIYGIVAIGTARIFSAQQAFVASAPQRLARLQGLPQDGPPGLYVLVIGESANRLHMSAYGYARDTTPWLRQMQGTPDCLLFQHAYANFVATLPALSYALTAQNQYEEVDAEDATTLIEAAKAAGFHTIYLSNQGKLGLYSTPLVAIASECDEAVWLHPQQFLSKGREEKSLHIEDSDLVGALHDIETAPGSRTLLVLHLMGSHNTYENRYPEDFHPFGSETLIDRYDNSIAYTDAILQQIYDDVRQRPDFACLVYFSDHGEAVDEGYMHNGDAYRPSMTYIPLVLLASDTYRARSAAKWQTLAAHRDAYFTNDLIYDLMLSLMDIDTGDTRPENDIASPAYDATPARFRTEHGAEPIVPPGAGD